MKKRIFELFQYVLLLTILFVSAMIFRRFTLSLHKFFVLVFDSVFYVFWGMWHHYHAERINKLLILEYSIVAVIVIFLSALGLGIVRFI